MIDLRHVSKRFGGHTVIDGVDLSVEEGEFVVFVGPSGCGKSTLLRMIAGLEEISSGDVWIGGERMTDAEPYDRGVAMVFQSYALYPHMTVAENMGFALRIQGLGAAERRRMVEAAARKLHLDHLLDRKPAALSGGQRQRVAIGRAIVRDPKVFLFDEPLSNLDAELRVQMRIEIARLHQTLANTMVYVTHDQTEAMTLADRIVVLRGGRIEQVGRPTDLYDDPDNLFVAGFIGSPRMNFLPGVAAGPDSVRVAGLEVRVPGLSSRLAPGQEVQVGLRPEHLTATEGVEVPLAIEVVEQLGAMAYVHGSLAPDVPVVAEWRSGRPRVGERVPLRFDPRDLRLFDREGRRIR
ncbi:Maltose/maltodextrin transport ATP-binding protein MalK [Rubellimicrobium mesophilum DSM 19309]|uniref:Maltose/maltodextrin transport ATP-binding protein MalK n=2 Tax=Rubellimicrobium TaxID=295418 RepID=A0A017HRL2_9RHOB|nr:Maltose/maltodextrin transport ATP-binding protein MalK [Rubellimicrobium mesophilum DSM 19309]